MNGDFAFARNVLIKRSLKGTEFWQRIKIREEFVIIKPETLFLLEHLFSHTKWWLLLSESFHQNLVVVANIDGGLLVVTGRRGFRRREGTDNLLTSVNDLELIIGFGGDLWLWRLVFDVLVGDAEDINNLGLLAPRELTHVGIAKGTWSLSRRWVKRWEIIEVIEVDHLGLRHRGLFLEFFGGLKGIRVKIIIIFTFLDLRLTLRRRLLEPADAWLEAWFLRLFWSSSD